MLNSRSAQVQPLKGIRVVEFTHMVMGPAAGLILADLGADVIRVELVDGDKTRNLLGSGAGYYAMYNRNKRSLTLDLKSPEGRVAALKLIDTADVFIENFRPGALKKLGFDYNALSERVPSLIYCSEKGFLSGPYESRTALDEVAQMMGGLAYMTGKPGKPTRAGASVIDVTGGMFGAIAILSAIIERTQTGKGKHIVAALFETTAFLVGQHMAQYAVTGTAAPPMPARVSAWAVYDVFEVADDEKIFIGVVSDAQWKQFCQAFGFEDWIADKSLALNNDRVKQRGEILSRLNEVFKSISKEDLMHKLESIGLPFAPISRPEDLFTDPHLNANGGLMEMNLPNGQVVSLPALPISMDTQRTHLSLNPPRVGEHSRDILASLGYSDDEIMKMKDRRLTSLDPEKPFNTKN